MNCAIVTTQQLQDNVDACLQQLSGGWNAPFEFALAPFSPREHDMDSFDIKTNLVQSCDISKFLGGQRPQYTRLYFCPDTYPPHPSSCLPAAGPPTIMSPSVGGSVVVGGSLLNTCTEGNDPPPSFLSLKCDLESEAFSQCNFGLISNGGGSARQAKNQYRRFVCRDVRNRVNTKYATSRKTAIQLAQTGNLLRTSKLINNRSGDRKDGKSKPRRTTTNIGNHSCTFCFTVRWDSLGLYISLEKSSGCPTHKFHIRSTTSSLPTRLLGDDERETLGHLAASCCTTGVGQSYLLAKVGRFMSNSKVAYIYDQAGASSNQPALDTNEAGTCPMSEYDHLTRYFEQTKDIAYTVLWDVCAVTPAEESTTGTAAMMNLETEMVSTPTTASSGRGAGHSSFLMSHTKFDNQNSCTKDHSNDPSMIGLREEGLTFRANYNVSHDTKVFLASIAWVFKPELQYFKLFPEVIHVDGTSHSTEKKYELITFSIKTSLGRQVVFLRVWLPDQKRSSFRWLFQHVLAGLVPSNVFQRTRLVMGDGDRQQQAEIEAAIQEYMPNARFGSCGWHIVDRGWRRNGPTTNSFSTQRKKKEVQIFFRGVRTWIYSWMRPGYCESMEEYLVSRRLLEEYIGCDAVTKILLDGKTDIVTHLKQFIRGHITVYDKLFLHCLRKNTRFLDVAHNSSHEGTNHGMKSCAAAVLPRHNPVKAAEHMVMQAVIATKRLEELSSKSLQQRKVWSELPTSPYLVTTAEDILLQQTRRYNQYSVVRVADDEFEVNVLKDQDEYQEEDQLLSNEASDDDDDHAQQQDTSSKWCPPIPRFMRTRTVKWDDEGRFYECSCCHFERTGIPCIHIYAVVKMLDPDWKGFTHHDVSVRWWSAYISHGFRGSASHNDDEDEEAHHSSRRLSTRLGNLADCDAKGPSVRSLPAPMFVDVGFPITGSRGTNVPAFCRVKNYPMDALHEIFGKAGRNLGSTETNLDMGLTQTTFDPDNSDDDDDSNDGVCNLFKDSLKQIAASDATLVLEDQMRAVEGHFKRIASLFPIVDTQGRDSAVTAISSIVSQLEDLVHEKENGKRNSSGGGTQGVVLERHNAKRRMYNTHNDYYR